ncbi:MAG: type IV secretion system DNA-binding domain-containing protein [Alphaproteobacteria bacterium]|nr:type IV secretion system DNA-binding domain-containing protein [Alphaproteobacteria bacterium]
MPLLARQTVAQRNILRDVRPGRERIIDFLSRSDTLIMTTVMAGFLFAVTSQFAVYADVATVLICLYARWQLRRSIVLPFKLPMHANLPDPHNPRPGKAGAGKSEGILYLGNLDDTADPNHGRELWLTNTDARTHILFLGTTGSGKTEGLKSIVANALTWGSGFVYVDGKADTDLWASLFALARRFGRDDDLLVLNYMTANSDEGAVSNTMNPFSNGSASYLTNMVVSLMPDAGGDNAMWKERAVALMGALMPALTWKRDKQGLLLDVGVLREYIELPAIIRLSRDPNLPERIIRALQGYLNTLPGYIDAAFDDDGNERPPSPDQPMYDLQVARQQHGYLSMQFTRSLQSLADEYGYIFKAQLADIDVLDVVLNRRILVALIPALEKSGDEAANLGKIIAASLKGMMGATLGNTVEGSWESAIGSKQTRSGSSFMTVFDEVGYYTAQGMAVMAAQARSLGFSLIFAAQDLPSMEKRVKQEAQSILGNCNLKIFGKLEDPTDTKKFFQDHVGTSWVMEAGGMQAPTSTISSLFLSNPFYDSRSTTSATTRVRADYDHLRTQREGEVHMLFADFIVRARMFHAVADRVRALRVHHMLPVPASTTATTARERAITEVASRLKDPEWTAAKAVSPASTPAEIAAMAENFAAATTAHRSPLEAGIIAVTCLTKVKAEPSKSAPKAKTPAAAQKAPIEEASDTRLVMPTEKTRAGNGEAASLAPENIISDQIRRDSTLPFHEGDEFAITELDALESSESSMDTFGVIPDDLAMDVVPRPGNGEEAEAVDVMGVELAHDVKGLLENVAQKLNKGLGGNEEKNRD